MSKAKGKHLSNAEIARTLAAVAQQLRAKGENHFKVRAYTRAADTIAGLGTSVADEVHANTSLRKYPGIGESIAAAIREIVLKGSLGQLELLLDQAPTPVAALQQYPGLDPKRVTRAYRKLDVSSLEEIKRALGSGELRRVMGPREESYFKTILFPRIEVLLNDSGPIVASLMDYLKKSGAERVEATGDFRRRVEVLDKISLVIETADWTALLARLSRYAGHIELAFPTATSAAFELPTGLPVTLQRATRENWGLALLTTTGSLAHLNQLETREPTLTSVARSQHKFLDEAQLYRALKLAPIPPELREGRNEVKLASANQLPQLVELADMRGELHAHTTGSDGQHSIEEMTKAAKKLGYGYLGITDHSQSLKIARGVSEKDLKRQLRRIDALNAKEGSLRILKSAEVDILGDGSLDYPDALLAQLDYTICSIHSKFRLNRVEQTERLMRAMDNPYFSILGHATGRKLLRRPGYELDFPRLIEHARKANVCFEINASPDRLDVSAETAREVSAAGIAIAICTDAHCVEELENMHCGLDVARRAGLEKSDILNSKPLSALLKRLRR